MPGASPPAAARAVMRDRIAEEIPVLRRFARGLTRDAHAADDLVQDCLERALQRQHMFDGSRNLRTWLFTIMRNLFLNGVRSDRQASHVMDELARGGDAAGQTGHDLAPQHGSVLAGQVLAAIDQLAHEQREVLLLVAVEGLSYREAAEVTGVPIGTVMSRLARAREQLRMKVEGEPRARLRRVK